MASAAVVTVPPKLTTIREAFFGKGTRDSPIFSQMELMRPNLAVSYSSENICTDLTNNCNGSTA